MTPAGRLRAAVDTIDHTANAATDGDWVAHIPHDPSRWYPDVRTRRNGTLQEGIAYDIRGAANAEHIALWDPPTALLTARMLRTIAGYVDEADRLGLSVVEGDLTTSALALADAILTATDVPA